MVEDRKPGRTGREKRDTHKIDPPTTFTARIENDGPYARIWALRHPDRISKATRKGWLAEQAKVHGGEIRREAEKLIGNSKDVIAYFKQLLAMEPRD